MSKYLTDSYDAALRENADLKARLAAAEARMDALEVNSLRELAGMEAAWRNACERGDKAVAENAALREQLARELDGIKALEAVIVSRGERLAEAEALLRDVGGPVAGIGWVVPNSWRTKRDAFLAADSASVEGEK